MKPGNPRDFRKLVVIVLAVLFGMAPTVGDIGSCGQAIDELDAPTFFAEKARGDCEQCRACALSGPLCDQACGGTISSAFPDGCRPLVHDGEVCLHALLHAPCAEYAKYMDPADPKAPSECQFCPVR